MDYGLSPLLRGSRAPVAACPRPTTPSPGSPACGASGTTAMEPYAAIAAQRPRGPGAAAVVAAARQSQLVARALKPYVKDAKTGRPAGAPGRLSRRRATRDTTASPRTCATSRRCSRCRWASGWPPSTRRATSTPTTTRRRRSTATSRSSRRAWPPSRPTSRRAASPTACSRSCGRSSAAGRRRTPRRHRPRGRRRRLGHGRPARAAGCCALPDLNAFDGDDNLKVTIDFRRVYASLLEQWLGTDADEVIPDAGRLGRVALVA